jgi:hypothetical protein
MSQLKEVPGVVPLHELMAWMGEVAKGVLLGHLHSSLDLSICHLRLCYFEQYNANTMMQKVLRRKK